MEILNAGSGLSVDDIVNEMQCTFVARTISPITPVVVDKNSLAGSSNNFFDRVSKLTRSLGEGSPATIVNTQELAAAPGANTI